MTGNDRKKKITIPIFVPHKGCPNDCVFCNQRKITGMTEEMTVSRAKATIEEFLSEKREDAFYEIAFFGGSFTAISDARRVELLQLAHQYILSGEVKSVRISTRPDAIDEMILEELQQYGVQVIELGVQSLDERVLQESNRGHDAACVYRSAKLIQEYGFQLGLQMMIGLPFDSEETIWFTANEFVNIKPDMVRIYPTLVVEDTKLATWMKEGKYQPLSLEQAVEQAKKCKVLFACHNIPVIRMGLQATTEIQDGSSVLAGPFHPAFGEMVYSAVYQDFLEEKYLWRKEEEQRELMFYGRLLEDDTVVKVTVPKRQVSRWIGNHASVKKYFRKKYSVSLQVTGEPRETVRLYGREYTEKEIFEIVFQKYEEEKESIGRE